jgi:hypothetical protein
MTFPFDPERNHMNIRLILSGLVASVALCAIPGTTCAQIFVAGTSADTIGKYTTSGATVNSTLALGLISPIGIVVSGDKFFVTDITRGAVAE